MSTSTFLSGHGAKDGQAQLMTVLQLVCRTHLASWQEKRGVIIMMIIKFE